MVTALALVVLPGDTQAGRQTDRQPSSHLTGAFLVTTPFTRQRIYFAVLVLKRNQPQSSPDACSESSQQGFGKFSESLGRHHGATSYRDGGKPHKTPGHH